MCQSCRAVQASVGRVSHMCMAAWCAGRAGRESSSRVGQRDGVSMHAYTKPIRDHKPTRNTLRGKTHTAPAPPLAASRLSTGAELKRPV